MKDMQTTDTKTTSSLVSRPCSGGPDAGTAPGRWRATRVTCLSAVSICVMIALSALTVLSDSVSEVWRGGSFTNPRSVAVNTADGSCWVADKQANEVVHLAADGTELGRGGGYSIPFSVSVDPVDGSCWVADLFHGEIVHLAEDGSELWRGGGFNRPSDVSVDASDGSCWVADQSNDEVVHLAPDGMELWRGAGFNLPFSVSADYSDSSCWVADRYNDQVVHLSSEGIELSRAEGLNRPTSVSVNVADGSCWVADTENGQVVNLSAAGVEVWRGGTFTEPFAVSVNAADGRCWVADRLGNSVALLAQDGTELWRDSGFQEPISVSVNHNDGSCWVADYGNGQVVRLAYQYTLSLSGNNGHVEVDGVAKTLPWSGDYVNGTEVTLEAIPDATYEFSAWSGDLTGSDNPTTVTVESDMSIVANFSKIHYQLDLQGVGEGTISVDGAEKSLPWSGLIAAGTSVSLGASPASCYVFDHWSGDVTGSSNPKSLTMNGPKSVTAHFNQLSYQLQVSGTGAGSVSVDGVLRSLPWSGDFPCGDTVTLEAAPDSCWQFGSWSGDLSGVDNPDQILIDGAKSVTANFTPIEYALSISSVGAGSILVDGAPHSLPWSDVFLCGSTVTVEAVPNSCYEFDAWSGDLSGDVNPRVITMNAAKSITAHFSMIQYSLDLTGDEGGTVTVDEVSHTLPWSGAFDCGSVVTLDAVPDPCYEFTGWTGDLTWASTPVDIVMDGDKSIAAGFSALTYTVTIAGDGEGQVSVDGVPQALPWSDVFDCDTGITLEALPSSCWQFDGWSGDLSGAESPITLTVDGDRNVTASFSATEYSLAISGADGSVVVNGAPQTLPWSDIFPCGETVTLEAVPDEHRVFGGWSGDLSGSENPTSILMDGDKSIVATFTRDITFGDVAEDYWAIDPINACIDAGIVTGYADGFYRPDVPVDRAAMAVYIARGLAGGEAGVPAGPEEPTFDDVPVGHWAYDHIEYAVLSAIVTGYGTGTYQPDWAVTRAQMAVFVARAVVDPTGEEGLVDYQPPETPTFLDVTHITWCFAHVEYLAENDIVSGYPDGYYRPTLEVTRDQMAVYIARAFGLLEE